MSPHTENSTSSRSEANLIASTERLCDRVSNWAPARWAAPGSGTGGAPRIDVFHAAVQRIADAAARAEGEPERHVPRLGNELALRDQLRVVVGDLVAARAPEDVLAEARGLVEETNRAL